MTRLHYMALVGLVFFGVSFLATLIKGSDGNNAQAALFGIILLFSCFVGVFGWRDHA